MPNPFIIFIIINTSTLIIVDPTTLVSDNQLLMPVVIGLIKLSWSSNSPIIYFIIFYPLINIATTFKVCSGIFLLLMWSGIATNYKKNITLGS